MINNYITNITDFMKRTGSIVNIVQFPYNKMC
jgi:hypothetical protein